MNPISKLIGSFFCLLISFMAIAQDNSPWRNFTSQTIAGVLAAPGSHEYSLTGGQGFAVYLRNDNTYPVTITGLLSAKTVCGTYVTSRFTATLDAGQIASGSDYDKGSQNGQIGVVTAINCRGIKYAKIPKYINRISTVTVSEVRVTKLPGGISPVTSVMNTTVAPTPIVPKFDSLAYYRTQWGYTKDSLIGEINALKYKNRSLVDTINYKTVLYNNLLSAQQALPVSKKKR